MRLRVGAEVIRRARPEAKLWVGTPTWPNHIPLLGSAGFEIQEYPYYDTATREVNIDLMLETCVRFPLVMWCCSTAAATTPPVLI